MPDLIFTQPDLDITLNIIRQCISVNIELMGLARDVTPLLRAP